MRQFLYIHILFLEQKKVITLFFFLSLNKEIIFPTREFKKKTFIAIFDLILFVFQSDFSSIFRHLLLFEVHYGNSSAHQKGKKERFTVIHIRINLVLYVQSYKWRVLLMQFFHSPYLL